MNNLMQDQISFLEEVFSDLSDKEMEEIVEDMFLESRVADWMEN